MRKARLPPIGDKARICKRPHDILVNNSLSSCGHYLYFIGTGREEHANYGVDFINATTNQRGISICEDERGISILSFGFRGVATIRESIHAVFLHTPAVQALANMADILLPCGWPIQPESRRKCHPALLYSIELSFVCLTQSMAFSNAFCFIQEATLSGMLIYFTSSLYRCLSYHQLAAALVVWGLPFEESFTTLLLTQHCVGSSVRENFTTFHKKQHSIIDELLQHVIRSNPWLVECDAFLPTSERSFVAQASI